MAEASRTADSLSADNAETDTVTVSKYYYLNDPAAAATSDIPSPERSQRVDEVQLFDSALSAPELSEAASTADSLSADDVLSLPKEEAELSPADNTSAGTPPLTLSDDEPPLERDGEPATVLSKYYYLNGLRIAKAVKKDESGWTYSWIHSDHLHSATILTDADGSELRRLAYRAFGEEAENSGSGAAPQYSYTGKERDASGLMYYGARYYDPALSRFITADTVYDRAPQGLNRYSYALNNPIRYNDPSGHEATPAYAWETSYDILPYFDETIDTGNNVADHALAIGAGVLNIGIMAVNAPFNTYGAVEEAYNAGTEAVIGQKGLSGEGLTTDLAILEACGMPLGSIIEQVRSSGTYLNTYLKSRVSSNISLADEVVDIGEGLSSSAKGELGEAAARKTLTYAGYDELPARLSSNNGFDGVFIKCGDDGVAIDDIIVTESKYSSTGHASLSKTKTKGRQLSTQWIDATIQEMLKSADSAVRKTGMLLDSNRSSIRPKANMLIPSGVNQWNKIKILD